jgi:hypothetical protein
MMDSLNGAVLIIVILVGVMILIGIPFSIYSTHQIKMKAIDASIELAKLECNNSSNIEAIIKLQMEVNKL